MTREDEGARDLLDTDLRDEIELVSDLVVAASGSDRHFTREEVDSLLGLCEEPSGAPADPPLVPEHVKEPGLLTRDT